MSPFLQWALGAALLAGFMGGVHCVGMCGGIVAAVGAPAGRSQRPWRLHLAYNAGRIASYGVAGALAGALGQGGLLFRGIAPVQQAFFAIASLMLLAMGLYLAGAAPFVSRIEAVGGRLWEAVRPYSRRFLPADTPPRAFFLGTLWGWLPCGLVYTLLLTALAMGSPLQGAMIMLAFGLGTLPNLLAAGMLAARYRTLVKAKGPRIAAGALVAGFGIYGLFRLGQGLAFDAQGLLCL